MKTYLRSTAANRCQRRVARPQRRRRGLGLIEMIISTAIAATLLTAAAAAFKASTSLVTANDEFFRASQAARISLHRILTEIRRGAVDEDSTTTAVRLLTADSVDGSPGQDVTYEYRPAEGRLVLVTNDDLLDPDYTLARDVTDMRFDVDLGADYNNSQCVARVSVSISIRVGGQHVRLSGSAAPRRNLIY